MSQFSDAFEQATESAISVFGDTCTINGDDYDCIIHSLAVSNEVVNGRPGRTELVQGVVIMRAADWATAAGAKGTLIAVGGGTYRVLNDPSKGFTSGTVELQLGPKV